MLLRCVRFVFCALLWVALCAGQFKFRERPTNTLSNAATLSSRSKPNEPTHLIVDLPFLARRCQAAPIPFPTCRADNIDCLRRGLRTFFIFMDMGIAGMKAVDPTIVNSVAVASPEEQMSILLRRANVTGARWTKLADRRFNLDGGKSGTVFISDLHVSGDLSVTLAARIEPYVAHITMDIQEIQSNITYPWSGEKGIDNEDYILIGPERIAVRNTRTPTFYLQPNNEDTSAINEMLHARPAILDHLSNEITTALMHTVVDNFRLFASRVPVKYYYEYY